MRLMQGPGAFALCRQPFSIKFPARRFYSSRYYDPLRILFCGSDDFSIASLNALHAYHLRQPSRVASIDVVCRPGKRVGRGLKEIREVPIKAAASALSLPIHEIDTFTGWAPPVTSNGPINLIIAVSFGLFVPPRILNNASYGGLNVHPSMLPDFRGPAPLHHTLMAGRTTTGVTLQTLHHKSFDHGLIISQTPSPGFSIPNPDSCDVPELLNLVSPKGAELLVDGIDRGLFVPPVKDVGWKPDGKTHLIHAGKIKPENRHIDWAVWTKQDIERRNRVLGTGSLWSKALVAKKSAQTEFDHKRVILTDLEEVEPPQGCDSFPVVPGQPFTNSPHPVQPKKGRALYVLTQDKKILRINRMKVEGSRSPTDFRRRSRLFTQIGIEVFRRFFALYRSVNGTLEEISDKRKQIKALLRDLAFLASVPDIQVDREHIQACRQVLEKMAQVLDSSKGKGKRHIIPNIKAAIRVVKVEKKLEQQVSQQICMLQGLQLDIDVHITQQLQSIKQQLEAVILLWKPLLEGPGMQMPKDMGYPWETEFLDLLGHKFKSRELPGLGLIKKSQVELWTADNKTKLDKDT
ncbi:hypothetical protein N7470_005645 [Penicillium chermesinum]|nr:hypothetical protein N7470_005645 [Penicillium chermesinum]